MLIETAQAAGVIDDAPTFADILLNAFDFLLKLGSIVGLIGIVAAGMLYFFAAGDRRQIASAKKVTSACVLGFVILFGAWICIKTIIKFFA